MLGVSISIILSNNGLISQSINASNDSIISKEKEQISIAWAGLVTDKETHKITDIDKNLFQEELSSNGNNTQVEDAENNSFSVIFIDTKHAYLVNNDGMISLEDDYEIPGDDDKEYTLNDYIKEGLVVWYDGIQNTRDGNNPNATVWEDLSGNNNDGILSSDMVSNQNEINSSSKGYYDANKNGYVFWHNDAYIQSTNNIGISGDDTFSVEMIIEPYTDGKNPNISANRHNGWANFLWFR